MKKLTAAAFALAASLAFAAPAMAQQWGDQRGDQRWGGGYGYGVANLQGLSVDQAKRELANSGYRASRSVRLDGRQYDLWANGGGRNSCIGFSSYNGRVNDVRSFSDRECGLSGGGWDDGDWDNGGWGGGYGGGNLRGLSVDQAKRSLRNSGFSPSRSTRIDGQQWDLWRDDRGRDCIGFTSYNGRVTASRSFRGNDCYGSGSPGGGWVNARDLRGLSVDQAKRRLADAGMRGARSINIRGEQWDLWRDNGGRQDRCIGFTSYNGRVTDADEFSSRDCY